MQKNIPEFISTGTLRAEIVELSEKELAEGKKNSTFINGIHFFIPKGRKNTLWNRDAMRKWAGTTVTAEEDEIANKILESITRGLKKV